MGDILDLIKSRRTIKEFLPKFVSWEKISRVLDAGRHAPSSGNIQNWRFIVVFDSEQKRQVAQACYGQHEISQAWVLIVICGEPERGERYYGSRGRDVYTIQNCAAAAQNMLLEAHSLGLGTRWVGAFDIAAVKSLVGVPEDITLESIIALGYPKEIPAKPPKYPLEPISYFSHWRSRLRDPHKYMNNLGVIFARKLDAVKSAVKATPALISKKLKGKKEVSEKKN
jgi:nitroreductase